MTDRNEHHDAVEAALIELRHAEQAGVFKPTSVDVDAVMRAVPEWASALAPATRPVRTSRWLVATRWLSAAAAIGLAVGVGSFTLRTPSLAPIGSTDKLAVAGRSFDQCDGAILHCLSGPSDAALAGACRSHDYDTDGDVDLADFRAYQLTCRGFGR